MSTSFAIPIGLRFVFPISIEGIDLPLYNVHPTSNEISRSNPDRPGGVSNLNLSVFFAPGFTWRSFSSPLQSEFMLVGGAPSPISQITLPPNFTSLSFVPSIGQSIMICVMVMAAAPLFVTSQNTFSLSTVNPSSIREAQISSVGVGEGVHVQVGVKVDVWVGVFVDVGDEVWVGVGVGLSMG